MTNQEASKIIKDGLEDMSLDFADEEQYEALTMAIKALEQNESAEEWYKLFVEKLEQEAKSEQFAKWVATEIFDEYWEYNQDAFAELACRKLAKLGIVRANGGEWELVEPQERSDKE